MFFQDLFTLDNVTTKPNVPKTYNTSKRLLEKDNTKKVSSHMLAGLLLFCNGSMLAFSFLQKHDMLFHKSEVLYVQIR